MNWRAREGIVDVTVGRLTHSSASQYLVLCSGMTVLSAPESPVVSLSYPDRESLNLGSVAHLQ